MLHGTFTRTVLDSEVLQGNKLGDPTRREVLLYLPPDYDTSEERYPTITLLTGFASTHRSAYGFSPWSPNTIEKFDQQIVAGESKPAILVLPDCTNRWGGSQFIDSSATGRYQTYLADEVIPHVDANYRTHASRDQRAVAGKSSGGFGALRLGMDRPDVVSVLASHAGDAAFDVSMRPMLTGAAIAIDRAGGLHAFCEKMAESGPRGGTDFDAIFVLASTAAYAPNDGPFPHCDLPMNPATGELIEEVWQRWLEHDPLERVDASRDAIESMKLIVLDAGTRDEHGLHFGHRLLYERLREVGVSNVELHEFDGGHRGTSHRYALTLPRIAAALTE